MVITASRQYVVQLRIYYNKLLTTRPKSTGSEDEIPPMVTPFTV